MGHHDFVIVVVEIQTTAGPSVIVSLIEENDVTGKLCKRMGVGIDTAAVISSPIADDAIMADGDGARAIQPFRRP